jgi:hypothetical protein
VQNAFFDAQVAENDFAWHLKHLFIDFIKVVFEYVQKVDYKFSGPFDYS